jgi:hypothetical protein
LPWQLVPFGQAPLGKRKKPTPLGYRLLLAVKYFFEKSQNSLLLKNCRGLSPRKWGGSKIFGVKIFVLVQISNILNESFPTLKVFCVNEGLRVEIVLYSRISPINGDRSRCKSVIKFLRTPARTLLVFESNMKLVTRQQVDFRVITILRLDPSVVQRFAEGVHLAVPPQSLQKFATITDRGIIVTSQKYAEPAVPGVLTTP